MKATLLVENNTELESFLSLNLLTWTGSEIISMKSAKFAIEYLLDNPNKINLIICKSNVNSERTAEAINQFLNGPQVDIPMIILGQSVVTGDSIVNIDSSLDVKPIIQASAKLLGVTAQDMAQLNVPDYFAIPIQFFNYITAPATDVYQQKDIDSGEFEICLQEFQNFPKELIKKYSSGGITHLYIKKNDRLTFVTNITQEIASKLVYKDLNNDEQVKALEMSQDLLKDKIARVGITEETIALAQKNLKSMAQNSKNSKSIMRLLKRLTKNKSGYLFKHSQLLMFMAGHLMEHLDWGNKEQTEKLQFVAFFHDIALENDEQAKIHTTEQLRSSDLPKIKKDLVNKHAQIAATLIATYPKAPMGSENIIKQHHGITHGVGFSEHFGANLSPITIVFILAEDFVDEMILSGENFDINLKIAQMRKRFATQRFQKIIDILELAVIS